MEQAKRPQIRELAPELAEVARKELNEVESEIPQKLQELRDCIEADARLKSRMDDQFLMAFLRFCKYDLDETKKRLEFYYTYKTSATDLIQNRFIDSKLLDMCKSGIFATPSRPAGPGGPRIHITRMSLIDTSKFTVQDIFRFQMFRSEIEVNTDDNWVIAGVLEIIDFSKIPYALLRQFEPKLYKKMAAFLEHGIPAALVGTHIINASIDAQIVLTIVRSLMKQKELLNIHTSMESLQKAVGKEYLPTDYGGENGSIEDAVLNYEQLLLSYQDYFVEDAQYGMDMDKAKNTDLNSSPLADCEGTFRRLNID